MKKLILLFYSVFEVAIVTKKKLLKHFDFKLTTSNTILLYNLKDSSLLKEETFNLIIPSEHTLLTVHTKKRQKKKP